MNELGKEEKKRNNDAGKGNKLVTLNWSRKLIVIRRLTYLKKYHCIPNRNMYSQSEQRTNGERVREEDK